MMNTACRPVAVVCVTAHWEAPEVTVSTAAAPPMLYDYGGALGLRVQIFATVCTAVVAF
jgi:aromatic ring-opening dioxygenase catalytic subunit (LigB family)